MAPSAYPDPLSELSPQDSVLVAANGESISSVLASQQKRKSYGGLGPTGTGAQFPQLGANKSQNVGSYNRNRDVSEYTPEVVQVRKPRHITVSESSGGIRTTEVSLPPAACMKREQYLAVERGLATPVVVPPTPPPSNTGTESDTDVPRLSLETSHKRVGSIAQLETFEAESVKSHRRRSYTEICELGTGTFSRVVLATSQRTAGNYPVDVKRLDPKCLVAVKIIEHGPAGGASEERVETSLKRELDILKSIRHPSLVHLRAFSTECRRSLLVLTYCPGGDMYDVASERQHLLTPPLIQRIFAELVAATLYLHEHLIVHRDIKLESQYPDSLTLVLRPH